MRQAHPPRASGRSFSLRRSPTWPWNVVWPIAAFLLGLIALVGYVLYTQYRAGRGYTALGLALGVASLALILIATAYSLRRRGGQERLPGTLRNWLWSHVALGLIALLFALLHGGFWPRLSFGWTALVLLAFVVGSGIIGRLLYSRVPGMVTRSVGNLVTVDTERDIERLDLLIDQQLAGRSSLLKERVADLTEQRAAREAWQQAAAQFPPDESQRLATIADLTLRQFELHNQLDSQRRYQVALKVWRKVHLPATVALLLALVIHLLVVSDLFIQAPTVANFTPPLRDTFAPSAANLAHVNAGDSRTCASCHVQQYSDWLGSMHSYAQTTTTAEWQIILYDRESITGGFPRETTGEFCVRCHAPLAMPMEEFDPVDGSNQLVFAERASINQQGVQCLTCHLPAENLDRAGNPTRPDLNVGGFAYHLSPSKHYVGSFGEGTPEDPAIVGNAYHRGGPSPVVPGQVGNPETFHEGSEFCSRCHNVSYPSSTGQLFELQKTYTEWLLNASNPGGVLPGVTCQECHMSSNPGAPAEVRLGPAAFGAFDRALPDRPITPHTFIGVDFPRGPDPLVDGVARDDEAYLIDRTTLLTNTVAPAHAAGQAGLTLDAPSSATAGQPYQFSVSIANLGAGHNFPTGFAFARQVWLDVTVSDAIGRVLLRSGTLDEAGDLVGTRCNNPTQQIVTQDRELLLAGGDGAVSLLRNKLGLQEVDESVVQAGGESAVLMVLQAQQAQNEAPVTVNVDGAGNSVTGDRRGLDGAGVPVVAGVPCVVNLQTQLFTHLPGTTEPAGEQEAYVQTRVLNRFNAACSVDPGGDECQKGPAQAFGIIAGQRVNILFNTLEVPEEAGSLTIDVALRFRNYPPYFLRALGRDMIDVLQDPTAGIPLDPAEIAAETEAMVQEQLDHTVTIGVIKAVVTVP